MPAGIVPLITERSEWHTPLAVIRTITSPGPGSSGVTLLDRQRLVLFEEDGGLHVVP